MHSNIVIILTIYCTLCGCVPLFEPPEIELSETNTNMAFSSCDLEVTDPDTGNTIFTMTARCFCLYDITTQETSQCSYPGPTLKGTAGTITKLTFYNLWDGVTTTDTSTQCQDSHNGYCGLDTTNIHTHGLHVSSVEDDVGVAIRPGDSYQYTYTIPDDHYPGTHWYHAHSHGSVSHQVQMGLFGALIMEDNDNVTYDVKQYESNILIFSWLYLIDGECDCGNHVDQTYASCSNAPKGCFQIPSVCYEYCEYDESQRVQSTFNDYNAFINKEITGTEQFFLVNGQLGPDIDININTYRLLKFINANAQYYIMYDLPTTNCEWVLLGYDGVWFTSDTNQDPNRDLNSDPFNGLFVLPPGGRADILVKCDTVGVYGVSTTQETGSSTTMSNVELAGNDEDGDRVLFRLNIVNDGTESDGVSTLPLTFPPKPEYLTDLRVEAEVETDCVCNTWSRPNYKNWELQRDTECGWAYNSKREYEINGVVYDEDDPYLTQVALWSIKEFIMFTDRHTHHQHMNGFQVQQDIDDGFVSFGGDHRDTLGTGGNANWIQRTYHADFDGDVMIHCHMLDHEDNGMMAKYLIIDDSSC